MDRFSKLILPVSLLIASLSVGYYYALFLPSQHKAEQAVALSINTPSPIAEPSSSPSSTVVTSSTPKESPSSSPQRVDSAKLKAFIEAARAQGFSDAEINQYVTQKLSGQPTTNSSLKGFSCTSTTIGSTVYTDCF